MNWKISSTLALTETSFNTGLSGPVTLQSTTTLGIPQKTSKMPQSPLNISTPGAPENWDWIHMTINGSTSEPLLVKGEKTPTPPLATAQDRWNDDRYLLCNATPTNPPYSGPVGTKEQSRAKKAVLNPGQCWTACYDDKCSVHLDAKPRAD